MTRPNRKNHRQAASSVGSDSNADIAAGSPQTKQLSQVSSSSRSSSSMVPPNVAPQHDANHNTRTTPTTSRRSSVPSTNSSASSQRQQQQAPPPPPPPPGTTRNSIPVASPPPPIISKLLQQNISASLQQEQARLEQELLQEAALKAQAAAAAAELDELNSSQSVAKNPMMVSPLKPPPPEPLMDPTQKFLLKRNSSSSLASSYNDDNDDQGQGDAEEDMKSPARETRKGGKNNSNNKLRKPAATTTLRVRIANAFSGRSKEVLLDTSASSSQTNLFDAVYNHPSVKAANVRKWNGSMAKEIRSGVSELQLVVVPQPGKPETIFSIPDLVNVSPKDLLPFLPSKNLDNGESISSSFVLELRLQCARKKNPATSRPEPLRKKLSISATSPDQSSSYHYQNSASDVQSAAGLSSRSSSSHHTGGPNHSRRGSLNHHGTTSSSAAPVTTHTSTASASAVLPHATSYASFNSSDLIENEDENDDDQLSNSVDLYTASLSSSAAPPSSSSTVTPISELEPTLRVRIMNKVTGRSKDVLVDVSGKISMFDAVYDHPSVKTANVRKWSSETVQQVKAKQRLIQLQIYDSEKDVAIQTLSISALKSCSTRQLAIWGRQITNRRAATSVAADHQQDISSESGAGSSKEEDPILLYLVCTERTSILRPSSSLQQSSDKTEASSSHYSSTKSKGEDDESTNNADEHDIPEESLLHRIGGMEALHAVVEELYTRILLDSTLSTFFENVNLSVLKTHQERLFRLAFTEIPDSLDIGHMLYKAHYSLFARGLNGTHFDSVATHLVEALQHHDVEQALIDEAVSVVAPFRHIFDLGVKFYANQTNSDPVDEEEAEQETLLHRLGGEAALHAAVEELYTRLVLDKSLAEFFQGVDLAFLKEHQLRFMTLAFTEIPKEVDIDQLLYKAHFKLFLNGLNADHFDKVAGHFVESLEHLQVEKTLIDEAVGIIAPLREIFERGVRGPTRTEVPEQPPKESLFLRLGGEQTLHATINGLYERIVKDEDLRLFFENVDLALLKKHQNAFMALLFTDSLRTDDITDMLYRVHKRLFDSGVGVLHFDKIAIHFKETLQGLKLEEELVSEAFEVIGSYRSVFNRHDKNTIGASGAVLSDMLSPRARGDSVTDSGARSSFMGSVPDEPWSNMQSSDSAVHSAHSQESDLPPLPSRSDPNLYGLSRTRTPMKQLPKMNESTASLDSKALSVVHLNPSRSLESSLSLGSMSMNMSIPQLNDTADTKNATFGKIEAPLKPLASTNRFLQPSKAFMENERRSLGLVTSPRSDLRSVREEPGGKLKARAASVGSFARMTYRRGSASSASRQQTGMASMLSTGSLSSFTGSQKSKSNNADRIQRFLTPGRSIARAKVQQRGKRDCEQPPIEEIAVNKDSSDSVIQSTIAMPGVSLPPELVNDMFPYHIMVDDEFTILQVGSSLQSLLQEDFLVGRCASELFSIKGPIPLFNDWTWSKMEKMKGKVVFFECFTSGSKEVELRGPIVEVSNEPKRVMFALSPNAKNLTELKSMGLTMMDLPLHTGQREAVLLGEHSASEVKVTHHLDQLHSQLALANKELEHANNQLATHASRQLEHFACMSHEIRTPLNCIVGMSSLLLEELSGEKDSAVADSVKMINTSGELLRAVVDDVLDYAKLESGSFEVDTSKMSSLQATVESIAFSIAPKLDEKNCTLRTFFAADLPQTLRTDSRRLQQVLYNLLGNAAKFSKANSFVDLRLGYVRQHREKPGDDPRDVIQLSVIDYGKGIEKRDFKTIFEPFSQASKETQHLYGGTGLGLSITKKLIDRLGGSISLTSELGKFTNFTVTIPFEGVPVDTLAIKAKFSSTPIVLLQPAARFKPVITEHEVIDLYNLNVASCESWGQVYQKLNDEIVSKKHAGQHVALVVHEELFDASSLQVLDAMVGPRNYTIMTNGPVGNIEATSDRHFKSLVTVFPSVLLGSISEHIESVTKYVEESSNIEDVNSGKNFSGPTITVSTPVLTPTTPQQTSFQDKTSASDKPTRLDKLKVLYAEDNLVNQKVLTRVLNRSGIKDVTIVNNGQEAVDICKKIEYDIIFMDVQMPVMDGMDACKLIVENDKDAKVVFVTAHALDEFKDQAEAAGGVSFISKPFRVQDIKTVLEELEINTG